MAKAAAPEEEDILVLSGDESDQDGPDDAAVLAGASLALVRLFTWKPAITSTHDACWCNLLAVGCRTMAAFLSNLVQTVYTHIKIEPGAAWKHVGQEQQADLLCMLACCFRDTVRNASAETSQADGGAA